MQVHECHTGQQVFHKESGKVATIRRLYASAGEVELAFENGTTTKVHIRLIEPLGAQNSERMRPCPKCAAKMALSVVTCPNCGFEYGVKTRPPSRTLFRVLLFLVLAAAGYAVWRWLVKS